MLRHVCFTLSLFWASKHRTSDGRQMLLRLKVLLLVLLLLLLDLLLLLKRLKMLLLMRTYRSCVDLMRACACKMERECG